MSFDKPSITFESIADQNISTFVLYSRGVPIDSVYVFLFVFIFPALG